MTAPTASRFSPRESASTLNVVYCPDRKQARCSPIVLQGEVPEEDAFLFLAGFMSWTGGGETGFAFLNLLRISPRLAASSD
jgi:hypothetical protein